MRHPIESLRAAGRAVVMAFSTFSRIPMPQICWEKANMRYLMCAFVLVGAVVGAAQVAWLALAGALGLSNLLQGVGYVLVAVGVTGGIHLDGLADVADALSSHAEPARKVEIMKDPHAGAFALIALVCYLMAQVALAGEAGISGVRDLVALGLIPLASRCTAGLATLVLPSASKHGMQQSFRDAGRTDARPLMLLGAEGALVACAMVAVRPVFGLGGVVVCAACAALAARRARKEFGGFNGDQAGCLLQTCELALLALFVVVQKAGLILFSSPVGQAQARRPLHATSQLSMDGERKTSPSTWRNCCGSKPRAATRLPQLATIPPTIPAARPYRQRPN